MDIPEIARLEKAIEMKREILRLAIKTNSSEEAVWTEFDIYRKTHPEGMRKRKPTRVDEILKNILHRSIFLTESPIEDTLRRELRARQIEFETQKKIGKYRVDFFFPQANLIVEADGGEYHSTPEQIERDQKRQAILMKRGCLVLRFTGREIYRNVVGCVDKIASFLVQAKL